MTPDLYLSGVLIRYQAGANIVIANGLIIGLTSSITTYANGHLHGIHPSGSLAKGTAIAGASDVDILVSVQPTATETLKQVYEILFNRLNADGYSPRRQNVSLGLVINGWKVDVVPAKKQSALSNEHSLWSHKKQSNRTTNIAGHINYVRISGRLDEIRLTKIWKTNLGLEFPSFLLEVVVINSLSGSLIGSLANNFLKVLEYIRDSLPTARIVDPTKPSNILSDELTSGEKIALSTAAANSLLLPYWGDIIS